MEQQRKFTSQASALHVTFYPGTGRMLETPAGVKLCGLGDGCILLWDKRLKRNVSIDLDWLHSLCKQ